VLTLFSLWVVPVSFQQMFAIRRPVSGNNTIDFIAAVERGCCLRHRYAIALAFTKVDFGKGWSVEQKHYQ
jgi:hypothetical protein